MNTFWTQLDHDFVGFFNPLVVDPAVRAPVRNGWFLQRLDYACYASAAYVTFAVGCKLMFGGKDPKSGGGEKSGKATVAEKIKKDGLLVFVVMAIYNATQVTLCGWMVYKVMTEHRRRSLAFICNVNNLAEDGIAFVTHVFYLSKLLDCADTVFMIIKGSWRQVSFLHVYHHSSIMLVCWLNANAFYDGDVYFTIVLNGAIHFIMYGYYLATQLNIAVPLFIKKSLTNAQLVQFCCMEAQGAYALWFGCPGPRNITIMYMIYISTMVILFWDFKRRTYTAAKAAKGAKKE